MTRFVSYHLEPLSTPKASSRGERHNRCEDNPNNLPLTHRAFGHKHRHIFSLLDCWVEMLVNLGSDTNVKWIWASPNPKASSRDDAFLHTYKVTINHFYNRCGITPIKSNVTMKMYSIILYSRSKHKLWSMNPCNYPCISQIVAKLKTFFFGVGWTFFFQFNTFILCKITFINKDLKIHSTRGDIISLTPQNIVLNTIWDYLNNIFTH